MKIGISLQRNERFDLLAKSLWVTSWDGFTTQILSRKKTTLNARRRITATTTTDTTKSSIIQQRQRENIRSRQRRTAIEKNDFFFFFLVTEVSSWLLYGRHNEIVHVANAWSKV